MSTPLIMLVTIGDDIPAPTDIRVKADLSVPVRGAAYSGFAVPEGGTAPYTFAIISGTIPAGMSFNNSTGEFTGTPTTQSFYEFEVEVTDFLAVTSQAVFSITVGGGIVVSNVLPYCETGVVYSGNLVATGGTPPYVWTLQAGSLPSGLAIVGDTLAGTRASVSFPQLDTFTLRCTDSTSNFTDAVFNLAVWKPITISDSAVIYAIENTFYSKQYVATWGDLTNSALKNYPLPKVQWQLETYGFGNLPAGLTFNPANATISGTPLPASPGFFDIIATDEMGGTKIFTVTSFIIQSIQIPYPYSYNIGDGVNTHFEILATFRSNQYLAVVVENATGKEVNCMITHLHNPPLFPTDDFIVIDTEKVIGMDEYKVIVIGQ